MSTQGPGWFDTHCHLQLIDSADSDVRTEAQAAGVSGLVCVGIDGETSAGAVRSAEAATEIWATVGLHPHEARHLDGEWDGLLGLLDSSKVVAVGETGFDFHWNHSPRDDQERAFRRQIALAKERDLALVIHTRDAWDATFSTLDDEGCPDRVVFHCFSGTQAEARRCVDSYGAWLSIAGPIGYPRNEELRAAARSVTVDNLVIETDAPFLSPQQFRGKPNRPAWVRLVGEALADALGLDAKDLAERTSANAARLFRLEEG